MTPFLLQYLCDPVSREPLVLTDERRDADGDIVSGVLVAGERRYPIIDGVPRFLPEAQLKQSVEAFGEEWNFFNYDTFKANWLKHIAHGAFGGLDYFKDKVIVDAAAGSGMHSKWMLEAGARHVIALELSDSIDGVMKENMRGVKNFDVIQCSIDAPPIKRNVIDGLVICNAAIQHTPSVEKTARALWSIVAPGGEFSFSCYLKYPNDPVWMARYWLVYRPLRAILSRASFKVRLGYARLMARLRFVPVLGPLLEQAQFMVRGDVPPGDRYRERLYETTVLNTFDWYGAHAYQHQLSADELGDICNRLTPKAAKLLNLEAYRKRGMPPGLPLRLFKDG
jgi:uncharacterized protein YbaR (Trm112 family)